MAAGRRTMPGMRESDIVYERGPYWVARSHSGFVIYRNEATGHSTRCAFIGYLGEDGLNRAKAEIERRLAG